MKSRLAARRQRTAAPQELRSLLDSLHSSAAAMPEVQALDEALESILSEVTEKLNFEFAAISLVDEYRNCIETVRGRNISPGWVKRDKHSLDVRDIQTHIVNTGETRVIDGWGDILDKQIYDRFEHWRLARVWAPILSADQKVVGTIEAGCNKERKDEVLTESAIARVKQLGRERGEEIAQRRPHVLLQGIAKDAIQLIGADSATLHVYRHKILESSDGEGDEWGEPILATGAGKATAEFVKSYKPRRWGRERTATRTGKPERVDNPTKFKAEYPKLYELGLRGLAVIPLALGPDTQGLLGIHFWQSGKRFTQRDLNLAEMFAREMEVVIQNYLLLRRATEAGGSAWALSGLQSLMQSLTSPFNLPDVLKKVAKNALLTLDADNVMVYQYHADTDSFDMPPVMDGQFLDPGSMEVKIRPDDMLFQFIKEKASAFIANADDHPVLGASSESSKPRFIDRERVKSCAVLVLRPGEMDKVVGLIFVNFREPHNFTPEEKRVMSALVTSAALAIRNARLHKDDLTRQLQAMHEVHAAIAEKGPDLKQVLQRLLQQTLELTGAKYGVCMRYDSHTEVLKSIAHWPPLENRLVFQRIGEGIIGLAARSKKSILVENVEDEKASMFVETVGEVFPASVFKKVNPDTRCELAVPLLDEGQLLGVLNIEHPEPRGLNEDHKALLETLAVPAIIAFHTVDLYKQLGRRIKHLGALHVIAARVQEKPYELDTILRLFLTGITSGEGLGFSRAMLFLAHEEGQILQGEAAIGAVTRQEAEEIWRHLPYAERTLIDDLDIPLRRAEQLSEDVMSGRVLESSPLTRAIQDELLLVDDSAGAVADCLLKGKTVLIESGKFDRFREVIGRLTKPDDVLQAFAAVPLIGKHKQHIGVLVVDNRFLPQERALDEYDIAGLEAFAGLMALSIENVRLQERLVEEQRAENWREITADIAHSVGTRISVIKGTVTRLRSLLEDSSADDAMTDSKALLDRLNDGISKAERVLHEFRTFSVPSPLDLKPADLRSILTDIAQDAGESYQVEMTMPEVSLPVSVDSFKLAKALMEILKNAHEAMLGATEGPSLIRVNVTAKRSLTISQPYVQLDISDNGPGIADEVKQSLFDPFVSTKSDGTGLGLAIARKLINEHGGKLEADNNPGGGARFVVRIPLLAGPQDLN